MDELELCFNSYFSGAGVGKQAEYSVWQTTGVLTVKGYTSDDFLPGDR